MATLLRIGLLKPSFVPSRRERELRDLSRYRLALVQERSQEIQRVQKILESANIKIGSLISDVNNMSGRLMLQAIIKGKLTPEEISTLGHANLKHSPEEYTKALKGRVNAVHQRLLSMQLTHIDELTQRIVELDNDLETIIAQIPNFKEALELIDSIPGVGRQSAMTILIEIGLDMSRFPTVKHLAAWSGVAPGNRESAGKNKPEKSRKGNKYLKAVLVQAAHSLHRKKNCHLREQYQRIKARRGSKKAAVAVAHTILRIVFYLLTRKEMYQELGANYVSEKTKNSQIQRYVKELAKLGLVIPNALVDQQLANSV
ncbi:IS110 family transposase [Sporomusa ovata]|uniref:IS110 family transposase n=2 Tax=Sporomusa ovata TaxID=2378 RepID=UPI001269564B|nr:IS110 family transposase [Sporomusa ovata]